MKPGALLLLYLPVAGGCAATPGAEAEEPLAPVALGAWYDVHLESLRGGPGPPAAASGGPGPVVERAGIGSVRLPGLHVRDEPSLRALMHSIAAVAGTNVVVTELAEQAFVDAGIVFRIERDRPITLVDALDLICELAGPEVDWEVRHGVVYVTSADDISYSMVTQVYDVSDLLAGVADFAAPSVGDLRLPADRPEHGKGPVLARAPLVSEERLLELIRQSVAPGTWDDEGVVLEIRGGKLIVRHRGRGR